MFPPGNRELVEAARSPDAGGLRLYIPPRLALSFDYRRHVWVDAATTRPSFCNTQLLAMLGVQLDNASFQEKQCRDAYLPNHLEFRARINRVLTNLLLGRSHWSITSLAEEATVLAQGFPCAGIDISPIKMDWLLRRFAVHFEQLQLPKLPQDLSRTRAAWAQRTQQYNGHILREDDAIDFVPCRPCHEIKQAQSPRDGCTLLQLPREILDLIMEFVIGRDGKTIWACHKYGPICANRETARCCVAHKDSLFYPGLEQNLLQNALTSSPWPAHHIKSRQNHLRVLIGSNMSDMQSDELMEYLDYGEQKNILFFPRRESLTASYANFHKLHCLNTNAMAVCKTLAQVTEEAMLRVKTIGIGPHVILTRHAGSKFGDNVLGCGRCISFLQKAKNLHIRCMNHGQLQATAAILLKRSDINNLTYRLPILDLGPLKGLRINNQVTFERLYPYPYPDEPWKSNVFVLDVIIKDWLEDDRAKVAAFEHLVARHRHGDAGCWHEKDFDVLWQIGDAWEQPPRAPMLSTGHEYHAIDEEYEDIKMSDKMLENMFDW